MQTPSDLNKNITRRFESPLDARLILDLEAPEFRDWKWYQVAGQNLGLYGEKGSSRRKSISNRRFNLLKLKQSNPTAYWDLHDKAKIETARQAESEKESEDEEEEEEDTSDSFHHYTPSNFISSSTMGSTWIPDSTLSSPPSARSLRSRASPARSQSSVPPFSPLPESYQSKRFVPAPVTSFHYGKYESPPEDHC